MNQLESGSSFGYRIDRITDNVTIYYCIGDGRQGGARVPKIREKYFSGNYYVQLGHFSGKNHVKFGNFVNFSGKYHKNRIFR